MITLRRSTREQRSRDRKRNRILLKIGARPAIHLTPAELEELENQARRLLGKRLMEHQAKIEVLRRCLISALSGYTNIVDIYEEAIDVHMADEQNGDDRDSFDAVVKAHRNKIKRLEKVAYPQTTHPSTTR